MREIGYTKHYRSIIRTQAPINYSNSMQCHIYDLCY